MPASQADHRASDPGRAAGATMSQADVEDASGIAKPRMWRYKNDHTMPSLPSLARICVAVGMRPASSSMRSSRGQRYDNQDGRAIILTHPLAMTPMSCEAMCAIMAADWQRADGLLGTPFAVECLNDGWGYLAPRVVEGRQRCALAGRGYATGARDRRSR
jgi:transcriptional regulator with XRE-family HTH domain